MIEHEVTALNNFIGAWTPSDTSICDKIIEYYTSNPSKYEGTSGLGVDKSNKDSLDCIFEDADLFAEYTSTCLRPAVEEYVKRYIYAHEYAAWNVVEKVGIQYYKPGAGYHAWHTERCVGKVPNAARHLVFMTYLNDVTDCGETEWYYQKLKVQPRKGLTVIWPADWTFTHRGVTSPTQDKYVVTGWFSYR